MAADADACAWEAAARAQHARAVAETGVVPNVDLFEPSHRALLEFFLPPSIDADAGGRLALLDRQLLDAEEWRRVWIEPVYDEDGDWLSTWRLLSMRGDLLDEVDTPNGLLLHDDAHNFSLLTKLGEDLYYRFELFDDIAQNDDNGDDEGDGEGDAKAPIADGMRLLWEHDGRREAVTVRRLVAPFLHGLNVHV